MELLLLLIIVVGLIFLRRSPTVRSKIKDCLRIVSVHTSPTVKREFFVKDSLLHATERALFHELKKQLPECHYIFPNMRVADIIRTPNGSGYYARRNKILSRHIDFLIADQYFRPIVAIELNGKSHHTSKQQVSDRIKNEVFQNAGLPLITLNVGQDFVNEIRTVFSRFLTQPHH